jgi:periplasmic protein TonB
MKPYSIFASIIAVLVLTQLSICQNEAATTAPEQVYRVGGNVKPPRGIYTPAAEYPAKAKKEHQQGMVSIKMVVGTDGLPRDVKVARSLSPELDEAATDAVNKWRFSPATKDGEPVAVQMNAEVSFH